MPDGQIVVTGTHQHTAWIDRVTPPIEEVVPGVWSIPIDFSQAPIRYTFCYLLVSPTGEAVVVDPGGDSELGRSQLHAGLQAAGVAPDSVVGVVSTHLHPDHLGLVGYAASLGSGWIGYHPRDLAVLESYGRPDAQDIDRSWLRDCGVPASMIDDVVLSEETLADMAALPHPTILLEDGDRLPVAGLDVLVVATPGHTPGHICLVDEGHRLVFSGDHVLPRITPNVGMTASGAHQHLLADYYRSLTKIAAWSDFEVCAAHEYRFAGLAARTADLAEHHRDRSNEIIEIAGASPQTVWEIAAATPWSRPWESFDSLNLRAALGETAAHVENLVDSGELVVIANSPMVVRSMRPSDR